ncbi:N/A [soil metagenome]
MTERFPVSDTFDAMGDDYYRDPARAFEAERKKHSVFWYPYMGAWVVTAKEDVETVLSDWQKFRSGTKGESIRVPQEFQGQIPADLISKILVGSDPPGHTLSRSVAGRGFVKPRMDALQPIIEERANLIIDEIQDLGAANLMDAYCLELTTRTFMALVDLPYDLEPQIRQARDDMFSILSSALEPLGGRRAEVWSRWAAVQEILRGFVAVRRASPGDDLISEMASAKDRDGNPMLSDEQIALHIGEFAGAATDTTAQAMANAVLFLSQKSQYIEEARQSPDLWWRVFDETVRRRPSGTATRWATDDTEIAGVEIKKGDAIWLALASANTDESYYDRPFEFDIHRELVGDHLAFTKGRHTCLGQPLARVQGSTGLKVLFERLPSLRPDADIPLDFFRMALLPVRRTLPVHWDVADARTPVGV